MRTRSLLSLAIAWGIATSLSAAAAETAPDGATVVYEVPAKGPVQLQKLIAAGFDVLAQTREGTLHVVAPLAQAEDLRQMCGWAHVLRGPAVGPQIDALDANLGAYRTYSEATAVMQALVAAHPTRASLISIGQSIEMRTIHALKISDNVATDESEPEVLFMGCHHARELMSVEIPLQFAEYLLAQYGTNAQVTQLVDSREIWIVPIVNPDGYVYVQNNHVGDSTTWWRKNRRNNGNGTFGVDLNRNYGTNWGFDEIGSSSTPSSPIYRGASAFSEPETRAIRDFCASRHFVMWLSYHSYSDLLLYPWGYVFDYTADHELFLRLGEEMVASNGYLAGNPAMGAIYRTNGGSDDWGYGDLGTKPAIYGFTPEVGSFADGAFAPPENLIGPFFTLLLPMNMKCLDLAGNPQRVLGPAPATITSVAATPDAELVLHWSGNLGGDPNPAMSYELEGFQMQGFQAANADAPSPWLDLAGGFATSSARAFSGSGSYYSGQADNLSATVTVAAPYRVTPATQTFSCRLWYAIELDYDYAYLEASEDQGIVWRPIAGNVTTNANPNGANLGNGITGTSPGWVHATFSLAGYLGQEILLRLRYVTDGSVVEEGLYVDAFDGVPAFGLHGPIASGIVGTSHTFSPAAQGTWTYRVRGTDADGDASRWSLGFDVLVDEAVDATHLPPLFTALAQNVPNPFNPFTTLIYSVGSGREAARAVRLEIFDAKSRRVMTLVDAALPPGQYRASWNGTDAGGTPLASGVYFARLQVDGEPPQSRKLLLLQ
ncbi:MAG TPA: M14 family zinc carboxypeptidase [Candidatus Krumholzibacteria bacterium]|nr:M14 family zinc carboxypeptidase [Candidatus Krumholzibacteria bacterium]